VLLIKSDLKASSNAEEPCHVAIRHRRRENTRGGGKGGKGRERATGLVLQTGRVKYDGGDGAFRNVLCLSLYFESGTKFVPSEESGVLDLVCGIA
jgi:hypothetical protein